MAPGHFYVVLGVVHSTQSHEPRARNPSGPTVVWAEVDSHWIFRLFLIVDIRKSRDYAYFGNTHILQVLDYAYLKNMHIRYRHDYAYFRNMHIQECFDYAYHRNMHI
jgi:hypothetical protein